MPPLYRPMEEKCLLKLYLSAPALKIRISDRRASEFLESCQLFTSWADFTFAGRLVPVLLSRTGTVVLRAGAAGLPVTTACNLL